jgi:D-alanine-D-alanine ligase
MRYARAVTSRVVLLFGGTSSERRVSVASAQNLCQTRPDAACWFIAANGHVHEVQRDVLLAHDRPFELDFQPAAPAKWNSVASALDTAEQTWVYLLALHGGEGENGELQRDLERRRLAFTGSGSAASELAFDKARAKSAVAQHGLRVAAETRLEGTEARVREDLTAALRQHGRLVVKPLADGSSIGLHHVHDELVIPAVAHEIAGTGRPYLAEEFVDGTELTVGVIDEAASSVSLPPSEVRLEPGGAFDFAGKYLGRGTRELTPAEVAPEVALAARAAAVTAHRALGCAGYSRTDLIAGARGICFLETNTLPGLTRMSFIPQQLAADGRTIEAFVEAQLQLAMIRRDRTP